MAGKRSECAHRFLTALGRLMRMVQRMSDSKKKFAHIKIGSLLNLVVGAVFVVVAVMVVIVVNYHMRQQALTEAESKARILLDRNLASHTYFSHNLKPRLFEWTEPFRSDDYFDPTWMSSTYAVREIDEYFKSLSPADYYYKECAINARSPENEADAYERAFIDELNANPELVERSVIRTLDGKPYFITLRRGEVMEETCLRCHNTPDEAPRGLIDHYGPERSFNREVGDVVSAISIRAPLAVAYAEANRFSLRLSGLLLMLLLCLFVAQSWLNKRLLFASLARIRDKALQISTGGEHLGEEIPLPLGRELSELTTAFNAMSVRLRRNVDRLEERVEERTVELKRVNAQLQHDITERKQAEKERERLLAAEREQRLLAETLAEVTLAITSLISHEAVLDEILRQVQRIVPYSTANIALLEGETLRVARWRDYEALGGEELISSLVQTLDDLTVDLDAIQSRQPLVISDTFQEPRWVLFDGTAWIRSYLVVPVCLHDQVLGLLRLDSDTPGQFSAEDGERLQPLANVAAIALENARLFGEVQRLAITDGLTGMHTRRHFFELAERELNRARRFQHPVSAIMLDLDHFKQVNDTYGHAVGDQVLRVVAERCGESIRDIDILGRYGGEEFAVILPGTDLPGAQTMAERLRRSVADAPIPTDKGDLTVTISLGVASSAQGQDDDEKGVAALLNRADAAMYAAKQAGRNRVAVIGQ